MTPADMLTTAEVAAYLGTTPNAIRHRVHTARTNPDAPGAIPFHKLGAAKTSPLRFRRSEIDAWTADTYGAAA